MAAVPTGSQLDDEALVRVAAEAYLVALPVVQFGRELDRAPAADRAAPGLTHRRSPLGGPWADPATLVSDAWLDLSAGPAVLGLPRVPADVRLTAEVLDPLGRSLVVRGSRDGARRCVVVGPGSPAPPDEAERLAAPSPLVRLVVRASTGDPDGVLRLHALQDRCRLRAHRPPRARTWSAPPAVDDPAAGPRLLDHLVQVLDRCHPESGEERALWERVRLLRLDVRRHTAQRSAAVARGLALGRARLHDLRSRPEVAGDGDWVGTTVAPRAVRAAGDPLAPPRSEVLAVDLPPRGAGPACGRRSHRIAFGPAVGALADLWTLTAYRARTGRPDTSRDAWTGSAARDVGRGALTVVVQHAPPDRRAGGAWLPVPDAPFRLVLRLYGPDPLVRRGGWLPPILRPVD